MNYSEELKRIAEKLESEEDRIILYGAAMQLSSSPEPEYEQVHDLPNGGVYYFAQY